MSSISIPNFIKFSKSINMITDFVMINLITAYLDLRLVCDEMDNELEYNISGETC